MRKWGLGSKELKHRQQDVAFYTQVSARSQMEAMVREFVIQKLPQSPTAAVQIMQVALQPQVTLDALSRQFPEFASFITENTNHA